MGSFLTTASKHVTDVRNFLRDSAGGNSIKYAAEKGARHYIYIPYVETISKDESGNDVVTKDIVAITGNVHEWSTADGKYKSTICLKDVVRKAEDGTTLNDGTCPFCDRVADAWNIRNYRKELEEATCQLTGDARKQHLEKAVGSFTDERKAKEARPYIYLLVVKFKRTDDDKPVMGTDGLPLYDLKVMKLSSSRVEKIRSQLVNSGSDLPGSELIFQYPSVDDRRLLVSQSTTSPVFPNNMNVTKYPAVLNHINEDVAKFEWEGIDKAFPEWAGMTNEAAKEAVDSMFEEWDTYQASLKTNPQAKYLEYIAETPDNKPSLDGAAAVPPVAGIPTIPNVPNIPNVAPIVPPVAPAPAPAADPNAVFAGATPAAPMLNI